MVLKIIDAKWEQRNLNTKTYEIIIESGDEPQYVKSEISKLNGRYIVVKIPSELNDNLIVVQELGFKYIEDMINVEHDLREVPRNRILQRLYDETTYRRMTDDDIEELFEEVRDGMFENDRISNDPIFGKELSAKRYMNWIKDLLEKSALFYTIIYKNDSTGFVVLETKDNLNYHSVLGGGYRKYRKSGIGIIQKEQEITKSLGGRKVFTSVSSNNIGQLKALIMNGYMPYSIEHILIKHV